MLYPTQLNLRRHKRLEAWSQSPSQDLRTNQTLLIKAQRRETEKSRSIHSSDYSEQSVLYIQLRSISEDTRD